MDPNVRRDTAGGATVLHVPVTYRRAGTEQIMLDTLLASRAAGWSTAAVVPPSESLDPFAHEIEEAGAVVARIGPLYESERNPARNLRDLVRLFRAIRPDIVHLHYPWAPTCYEAILACAIARVPIVVRTEHNPIPSTLGIMQVVKLNLLDRFVDVIVCVSRSNRDGHVERARRSREQFEVIANGVPPIDPDDRRRSIARAELGLGEDTVACVMVGALEERKGVTDLVHIAASVDASLDVRFFVVGEGPLRERAERLSDELDVDDRVRFLGQRSDVRDLLPGFDVFLQPSHHEGMSLAMLEALHSGLPMVTTAVDGVDDVFPDGEGAVICPIGDLDGFARGVEALATSAERRRRLSAISRSRVRSAFTTSQMTDAYLDLYRRLRDGRSARAPARRWSRRRRRRAGRNRSPSQR